MAEAEIVEERRGKGRAVKQYLYDTGTARSSGGGYHMTSSLHLQFFVRCTTSEYHQRLSLSSMVLIVQRQ